MITRLGTGADTWASSSVRHTRLSCAPSSIASRRRGSTTCGRRAQVFQNLKEEGVRLTELARTAGIAPQSMGALVDDLERLGYVERIRDPHDRRAALIRPTDRGRAEVRAARKVIAALERQWARTVGEERFATLMETLDELNGEAQAADRLL